MKSLVLATICCAFFVTIKCVGAVDYCDKSLCTGFDGEVQNHIACKHSGVKKYSFLYSFNFYDEHFKTLKNLKRIN